MPESKKRKHNPKKKHKTIKIEPMFMKYLKPINPDDTFNFSCSQCGECCKKIKYLVAMEAIDFFKLSRYLKQTGAQNWRIEDFMYEYTTLIPLTDFFYPMHFLKTVGSDDACIFLKDNKCSIHNANPRTCRMYPLSTEPVMMCDEEFKHYIITEKKHHFIGSSIRVKDWMAENHDSEYIVFTKMEFQSVPVIGRYLRKAQNAGMDMSAILMEMMFYKYLRYDVDEPFMLQYRRNMEELVAVLDSLIGGV